MPRICSDKPLRGNNTRENAGVCFKKGLRAGFAAGIQKGSKVGKTKQSQIAAASSAVVLSKFKSISSISLVFNNVDVVVADDDDDDDDIITVLAIL